MYSMSGVDVEVTSRVYSRNQVVRLELTNTCANRDTTTRKGLCSARCRANPSIGAEPLVRIPSEQRHLRNICVVFHRGLTLVLMGNR